MISVQNSTILLRALNELNAIGAGDTPQPDLLSLALQVENEVLDDWNAERGKIFANLFYPFTIIPNQNPTSIGPGADWNTGTGVNRPESIDGIQVFLTGTPVPSVFVRPRDAAWWQTQPSPTTTTPFPTDFYYNPTWTSSAEPWGELYLWPVPTTAYEVQVWVRGVLAQLTVNVAVSLPPGYNYALMMTTAERLASAIRKPWTPMQARLAAEARTRIESANTTVPRLMTQDAGMPSAGQAGLPNFMWPSGSLVGPR
ncbi:MAG TPA: hypothetical protein VJ777_07885 [Mycobacterium sp.]|nr:hypothetical protein [Mycobacterium sp.]